MVSQDRSHTASPPAAGVSPSEDTDVPRLALVTGATGYVGGELVAELLRRGWAVRTLSRRRDRAESMSWGDRVVPAGQRAAAGYVEVHEGDAGDDAAVRAALEGADAAWYLLHSMSEGADFRQEEARLAGIFARAAASAGTHRIVYLGGLHPEGEELSEHLASRVEVGRILLDSGVPTAALQAGVVLGEGSSSFAMLRHLSERLPGAIGPKWIRHRITPIGVRDVVFYLAGAGELDPQINRTFDVGGADTLSYAEMMQRYARVLDLPPRPVFTAPVTTARLAAHWVGLVTPVSHKLATPLIGSLLHDTVVRERDLQELLGEPDGGLQSFEEAVLAAVRTTDTRRWRRTLVATSAATAVAAVSGVLATDTTSRWYRTLRKPSWMPAGAIFPLVWNPLYADISVVSALMLDDSRVAGHPHRHRADACALGANLVLNGAWSWLFFRSHRPRLATVGAATLAVSSGDLVRRAYRSAPERGVLLAPYAGWTGFTTALSWAIARRNPRLNRARRFSKSPVDAGQ